MRVVVLALAWALCAAAETCAGAAWRGVFARGDELLLALELEGEGNPVMAPVCVRVDEYSAVAARVTFATGVLASDEARARVHLYYGAEEDEDSAPKRSSEWLPVRKGERFVPYRTLVVRMEGGAVVGCDWDTQLGCEAACGGECIGEACAAPLEDEGRATTAVFVAFDGTDAAGAPLVSVHSTDANFRFASGKALFDAAAGVYASVAGWFESLVQGSLLAAAQAEDEV